MTLHWILSKDYFYLLLCTRWRTQDLVMKGIVRQFYLEIDADKAD